MRYVVVLFCMLLVFCYKNKIVRKTRDGTKKQARMSIINSVVRCKLNECKLCCMDRDINASKNILFLLHLQRAGKKRPQCFTPNKINYDTP